MTALNEHEATEVGLGLKMLVADYERRLILTALSASGGNQRRAAASLGVLPTTLLEKMKRLGVHAPRRMAASDPLLNPPSPLF